MEASLGVPTATSQRQIPIKLADENRRLLNDYRAASDESKISFTHLFGWAIVEALRSFPRINDAYDVEGGAPVRRKREEVRLGLAVDVEKSDGTRTLLVPNVKAVERMTFREFAAAADDVITRARKGKIQISDFEGTTVSLTNPGTLGTTASVPRLMPGQSVIVATGAMGFPAEFAAMAPETIAQLAVSKVVTFTSTYDHRIVQGAESGAFLGRIEELLLGKDGFYENLFADLGIPHKPYRWAVDRNPAFGRRDEIGNRRAVLELINAYRVRGHLIADIDPLRMVPVQRAPGARPRDLRPHDLGPRSRLLDRRSEGRRPHAAARHHRRDAPRVLRQGRDRVSLHLQPRREGVGPRSGSAPRPRHLPATCGGASSRSFSPPRPSSVSSGRSTSGSGGTRSKGARRQSRFSTSSSRGLGSAAWKK